MPPSPTVGRPRKPEAIRKLQGSAGHSRPINTKEPKFETLRVVPEPPDELGDNAKRMWRDYAPQLVGAGVLTTADLHVLSAFCDAWERWCECMGLVREQGSVIDEPIVGKDGDIVGCKRLRNPASVAITDAWKVVRECGSLLGLDPSSRSRLVVDKPEEANPFLAITGGKSA